MIGKHLASSAIAFFGIRSIIGGDFGEGAPLASDLQSGKKFRFPLLLALALLSLWTAFDMLRRFQQDLLWGYRPLVLLTAGWALLILLLAPRFSRYKQRGRWLGLSTLSGLLLAAGFPDVWIPVPLLMFVGFLPLLLVEREIAERNGGKAANWEVLKFSYHSFVVWNILATFWVANSALAAGLVAILVNSALMCIPFVLFHWTARVLPRLGYLAFIVFWITFEYGHLNWDLTWPWLTLGNSFAAWPFAIQWYEYTGAFGGSLWILVMNVLFLQAFLGHYRPEGASRKAGLLRPAALLLMPLALSLWMFFSYEEKGDQVEVVVVQPNFEPHFEKFLLPEPAQVERFLQLASSQIRPETDYLVFPETSFGYVNTAELSFYPPVVRLRQFLENYPETRLITGLSAYDVLLPGEPQTQATRFQVRTSFDTLYFEVINAAVQLTAGENEVAWYRKSKLVPGPEIFPFRKYLWFFAPVVRQLQGTWEGVGTQPQRTAFRGPKAAIGPVICYESVFGEYFTGYIRQGAQAIFIVTNDGWWDRTPGHRQHLHFASLRAIETRRDIARSANTGISCFIDQRGIIRQATTYGDPAAIRDKVTINNKVTFYVQWGDLIARLALFTSIILVLNGIVRSITGEKK